MKAMPAETVRDLESRVPGFVRAVRSKEAEDIVLTLDAFAGDPELFYLCAWYASCQGKHLQVAASPPQS